jgi:hypothetical protein
MRVHHRDVSMISNDPNPYPVPSAIGAATIPPQPTLDMHGGITFPSNEPEGTHGGISLRSGSVRISVYHPVPLDLLIPRHFAGDPKR